MKEQQAIEILKEMYDRHDLPQDCLQALSKGIAALKTERMARTAIGKSADTVQQLGRELRRVDDALSVAARQYVELAQEFADIGGDVEPRDEYDVKQSWTREDFGL